MALFAIEAILSGLTLQAVHEGEFLFWYRATAVAASFLPGAWLLFSLSYGRANYREFLRQWAPALSAVFGIPVLFSMFLLGDWTAGIPVKKLAGTTWYLALGWAGYFWSLAVIAGAILIMMNLERTLRHSTGTKRWKIKFMIIGVGALFGVRIYTSSLSILFSQATTDNLALQAGALLVADVLIARSVLRNREMAIDIYLSHAFLYNSLTIFLIGVYFVGVGLLAWLTQFWLGVESLPLTAFIFFVAVMGLGSLLLSDHVRLRRKRMISRLFKRPLYDYRQVWSEFTEATSSLTNTRDLCRAVCRIVSETLESLSVSIWIADEGRNSLKLGASTDHSEEQARSMKLSGQAGTELILALWDQEMPVDFNSTEDDWLRDFSESHVEALAEACVRYAVPLRSANRLVGVLTISGRVTDAPLSAEDQELLKTIADQAAASLLNIQLAEHLHKAKALEALQTMSAFFMHDLKNLGSKLSLVTQNLPVHFDNPEFRQDAIRSVTQSVAKINSMCSRLSLLSERLEIHPRQVNIVRIVSDALKSLDGMFNCPVRTKLEYAGALHIDGEQMQKVIVNLLLNANDALPGEGEICVTTSQENGWAQVAVSDTGCGMSPEFIRTRLFRLFQTTKPKGMGIGLFHCKTIVEAHGGRIEVESQEGEGTTFRVLLPQQR
jgi:putative PEP-CTERM system histidine kinase